MRMGSVYLFAGDGRIHLRHLLAEAIGVLGLQLQIHEEGLPGIVFAELGFEVGFLACDVARFALKDADLAGFSEERFGGGEVGGVVVLFGVFLGGIDEYGPELRQCVELLIHTLMSQSTVAFQLVIHVILPGVSGCSKTSMYKHSGAAEVFSYTGVKASQNSSRREGSM